MALNNRKGGMVARVRVSPKDCLAIVDIMKAAGMDPYLHSFSGCVAIALSSLIGVARKGGIIAREEDGFQYLQVMEPFMGQSSTLAKRERTNTLYERAQAGIESPAPVLSSLMGAGQDPALLQEYEELKKDLQEGDPDSDMLERFSYLQGVLFP